MTGAELNAIAARARAAQQRTMLERVARTDVPALIAEVDRWRELYREAVQMLAGIAAHVEVDLTALVEDPSVVHRIAPPESCTACRKAIEALKAVPRG